MILQGWGYGIDGKPVPNSGTPLAAIGQVYPLSANVNGFASGYLTNSINWPTGPIDLRWNKFNATWVAPGMIVHGVISGANISRGTEGKMAIYINDKATLEWLPVWNAMPDSAPTGYHAVAGFELLSNRWLLTTLACNIG